MQTIGNYVYIENQYAGVTLGAIALPRGMIYIDAPLTPEDGRAWRASLIEVPCGPERLLINLDSHPDRTLGARSMDCPVLAHEKMAQYFRGRSATFRTQSIESGSEWETMPGLGNIRWAPPEIFFTERMGIFWGGTQIYLESHPGSDESAIWILLPEEKIVFVGDAVVKNQPPFTSTADIPLWIESLERLLSEEYRGYHIISGRGGRCASSTIRKQIENLQRIHEVMEKMAAKNAEPEAVTEYIPALLKEYRMPASRREQYTHRLQYGLLRYYIRHYQSDSTAEGKK